MSEEKKWWYAKADKKLGPHTATELKTLVASGEVMPTDQVWKEGLANWVPAASVTGLFVPAPPPLNEARPPLNNGNQKKTQAIKNIVMWILGVFFALVLIGVFANYGKNKLASTGNSAEAEKSEKLIYVGDTFTTENFEITVQSAEVRGSVGKSFFNSQPADGAVYIAVVAAYKNISQKPINAFSTPNIYLIAPDGTKYEKDIGASSSYATERNLNRKVFSDLNPGIKVKDADVFEVSQQLFDPKTWKIVVNADDEVDVNFVVVEEKEVEAQLQPVPTVVAEPSLPKSKSAEQLAQEKAQQLALEKAEQLAQEKALEAERWMAKCAADNRRVQMPSGSVLGLDEQEVMQLCRCIYEDSPITDSESIEVRGRCLNQML